MTLSRILVSIFLCFSGFASADTIEVFTRNDFTIKGHQEAKDNGHNIITYQMDGVDVIQEKMAKRANKQLKTHIDALVKKVGLDKLVKMTEFNRNQLLLKQLKNNGIDTQSLSHSLVTQQDREKIKHAIQDLVYAENNGITEKMLPAIIFKGRLYKNTSNIAVLFQEDRQ